MRVILDTNVLVSALIQKSYPYFVVDRVLADAGIELCFSEPLFAEYVAVLNRDKFARFPHFHASAQILLSDLEARGTKFAPGTKVTILRDEPDNRLLELAEACSANYLVTGNTNDFTISEYKGTWIISPRDFFEILNQ